ncbi:substrate-binding periplasmic protein [Maridesulfovibrio frigidus]|uniref:substrate-binding periplasmic protein n=1 Tax=Maridesulfovibrio frigidus TaxID=340956 RepID=UPI0004E0C155|nr:transporter substrate-binding domain-containing protein [Maridesulfovibrio frigidus]
MHHFIYSFIIVFIFTLCSTAVAQGEVVFASGSPLSTYQSRVIYPLLKEAFKRNGVEFDAKSYPSPRSLLMSNSGALDGELHRVYNFHEVSGGQYPNLVRIECDLLSIYLAVFSKNADVKIVNWEQLVGSKVGFVSGKKYAESFLGKTLKPENIIRQSSEPNLFKMLAKGYIEYAISGGLEGKRLVLKHPDFHGIKEVGKLKETKIYAYMHKKHAALAEKVAITLIEMKKDGAFKKIVNEARHSYCEIEDCKKMNCTYDCLNSDLVDKGNLSTDPIHPNHFAQSNHSESSSHSDQ